MLSTKPSPCQDEHPQNIPSKDLPRRQRPPRKNGTDDLPAPDVDVAREEHGHVVRRRERVGGDVRAERGEQERERRKEGGGAVVPLVDELKRVPENLAVEHGTGRGHHHADEARKCEGHRDDGELDVLTLRGNQIGVLWIGASGLTLVRSLRIAVVAYVSECVEVDPCSRLTVKSGMLTARVE